VATGLNGNLGSVVRFGAYEVDPHAGELRRNGVKVKLQDQPFQVLTMLLERPGEVISREELQRRLWPADTFVDFDHSLNAAIKRLRDALRDSADNPRFVETLARRGYRFVAPVAGTVPNGGKAEVISRPGPGYIARWVVGTLVIVVVCMVVGWHVGRSTFATPALRERRLTANSPDLPVYNAAISPNGKFLAYSDPRGVFLRALDTEESHPLSVPEGFRVHGLSWLPDGAHLLVTAVNGPMERPSLWNVSVWGGPPRKIAEGSGSGSVSPDGKTIALLRSNRLSQTDLYLTNAEGNDERKVAEISGYVFAAPAWSPDGLRLAYPKAIFWQGYSDEKVELESFELKSGKTKTILSDYRLEEGVAWTRDGRLLFSLSEEPPNQVESNVWALHIDGRTGEPVGKAERITSGPDAKPLESVSTDGKRMAFIRTNIVPTVYITEVNQRTKQIGPLQRLTLDELQNRPYEWTPDGKAVLYVSNRDGGFHIFRQDIDSTTPEQVVGAPYSTNILRLNPEGTEIFFTNESPATESKDDRGHAQTQAAVKTDGKNQTESETGHEFRSRMMRMMHVPLSGGTPQVLFQEPGINNFQCARAPSQACLFSRFVKGAMVFFKFDPVSGATKEWIRVSDASPEWEGYNWTLSPDGTVVALSKGKMHVSTGADIRLVPLEGGAERVLHVTEWAGLSTIDWAADGKSLWASARLRGETRTLVNIDLQGRTKSVLEEKTPHVGWAIPSRDGKRLAILEAAGDSNVWLMEGF
jgi:Tol biopolymer transport system component/DNA-binding winged helix-turn-helix (wHTH) protein